MKLEILVGPLGSGKSTYARRRADQGALIVNLDKIITMTHGTYRYVAELRDYYRTIEELAVVRGLETGCDVIVDRTNLTVEARRRWVSLGQCVEHDFGVDLDGALRMIAVTFPIEPFAIHARRRYWSEARGLSSSAWLKIAEEQVAAFIPVSPDEGFDRILEAPRDLFPDDLNTNFYEPDPSPPLPYPGAIPHDNAGVFHPTLTTMRTHNMTVITQFPSPVRFQESWSIDQAHRPPPSFVRYARVIRDEVRTLEDVLTAFQRLADAYPGMRLMAYNVGGGRGHIDLTWLHDDQTINVWTLVAFEVTP